MAVETLLRQSKKGKASKTDQALSLLALISYQLLLVGGDWWVTNRPNRSLPGLACSRNERQQRQSEMRERVNMENEQVVLFSEVLNKLTKKQKSGGSHLFYSLFFISHLNQTGNLPNSEKATMKETRREAEAYHVELSMVRPSHRQIQHKVVELEYAELFKEAIDLPLKGCGHAIVIFSYTEKQETKMWCKDLLQTKIYHMALIL